MTYNRNNNNRYFDKMNDNIKMNFIVGLVIVGIALIVQLVQNWNEVLIWFKELF